MQWTQNELSNIQQQIKRLLNGAPNLKATLLFKLRWNLREVEKVKQIIEEDFKRPTEDQQKQIRAYQQEKRTLILAHDGQIGPQGNVLNLSDLESNDKFIDDLNALSEDNAELLNDLSEIREFNAKRAAEECAEVELTDIPLSEFPETIEPELFGEALLYFVKES